MATSTASTGKGELGVKALQLYATLRDKVETPENIGADHFMMVGSVSRRHALPPIMFRLPSQPDLPLDFVVDTGRDVIGGLQCKTRNCLSILLAIPM